MVRVDAGTCGGGTGTRPGLLVGSGSDEVDGVLTGCEYLPAVRVLDDID